jgi:hypothetical protein
VTEVHLDAPFTALYDYWNKKRGRRAMPARREIDPLELPARLLPFLFMVDLSDDPPRWRYRLMGTEMVDRIGVDLIGRFHDDVLGTKYCTYLAPLNDEVFRHKHPIYTVTELRAKEGKALITKRLLLPLEHRGREPAIILGAQTYHGGADASLVLTDQCEIEEVGRRVLDGTRDRLTRPKNQEAVKLRGELERYRSLLLFTADPHRAEVFRELIAQIEARLRVIR